MFYVVLSDRGRCSPPPRASRLSLPRAALFVAELLLCSACLTGQAEAQAAGHWRITYTYNGTTTSQLNGAGAPQPWPPAGPIADPIRGFASGDEVTVGMSGTITATLDWVDQNGNPLTDPPPPAEVFVLQRATARWTVTVGVAEGDSGGDVTIEEHGAANGLGAAEQTADGPPTWEGVSDGRKLLKVDGSSGTITLPATLDAHVSFTCTSGSGSGTAHVGYAVVEVAPADCYDFSGYPNPPPSASTPCAQDAAAKLQGPLADGTGYYTEDRSYTNQTAQHAIEQLKKTAIFYVLGHGGTAFQSCQTFWNNNQWGYMVETEYARQQIVNSGVPAERVVALASLPAGALSKVLLAVFEGCWTGYYNATWGSPVHGAVVKGADCALGFTGTIRDPSAHTWADRFWTKLQEGRRVSQAASQAAQGLPLVDGLGNRVLLGGDIAIHPARHGQ